MECYATEMHRFVALPNMTCARTESKFGSRFKSLDEERDTANRVGNDTRSLRSGRTHWITGCIHEQSQCELIAQNLDQLESTIPGVVRSAGVGDRKDLRLYRRE